MKRIEAIIRPSRLEAVRRTLARVGVSGATATQVRGFGRQGGGFQAYPRASLSAELVDKVKVEVVVADDRADVVLEAIVAAARTHNPGDGKVFVTPIDDGVRIRTGECGGDTLKLVDSVPESP